MTAIPKIYEVKDKSTNHIECLKQFELAGKYARQRSYHREIISAWMIRAKVEDIFENENILIKRIR